ncbi:hypothetical protein FGB62_8g322 [Gracilaria domingensis]|nr:hypothetical protein FGB62_8g322 [Gracilaria domingensis]
MLNPSSVSVTSNAVDSAFEMPRGEALCSSLFIDMTLGDISKSSSGSSGLLYTIEAALLTAEEPVTKRLESRETSKQSRDLSAYEALCVNARDRA